MYKRLCVFFLCALLTIVMGLAAAAEEKYSLAQALSMVGTEEGRANDGMIELEDDLSQINLYTEQEFEYADGKIIILCRQNPEKEYQWNNGPFSEDYEGKNVGEGHVFLCSELMESIPAEMRATRPEEASAALVMETDYIYSGYIQTIVNDERTISALIHNDDSLVEVEGYHPIFVGIWTIYLYSFENNGASLVDFQLYPSPDIRKNPEADDIWQNMQKIHQLSVDVAETTKDRAYAEIAAIWSQETDKDSYILNEISERFHASFARDEFSFLSDEQYGQIAALAEEQDFSEVAATCADIFWEEFEELKRVDPSLDVSVLERDQDPTYETIQFLIKIKDYDEITMTDNEIIAQKAYMGQIDEEELKNRMNQVMALFSLVEWDMTFMDSRTEENAYDTNSQA